MGNYRFRLADMMPNAWFYKLRDISRTRSYNPSHHAVKKKLPSAIPTAAASSHKPIYSSSYYQNAAESLARAEKFYTSPTNTKASDTHFPDLPRKSSKRRLKRKTVYKPSPRFVDSSVSTDCSSCRTRLHYVWSKPEPILGQDYFASSSDNSPLDSPFSDFESEISEATHHHHQPSSFNCKFSSSATDIIIDMKQKSYTSKKQIQDGYHTISEIDLPPILTKPKSIPIAEEEEEANFQTSPSETEKVDEGPGTISLKEKSMIKPRKGSNLSYLVRKSASHSAGVKLRANSPKLLANKKIHSNGRKSVSSGARAKVQKKRSFSQGFAIVKSSLDPHKDFMDSMVEMILENNIRASKDLEELLACYLTLNADEYHGIIVKAFEQIWFDMPDLRRM